MSLTGNLRLWKPGQSGNPKGRPPRGRGHGIWSSKAARVAFEAAGTPEGKQAVAKAVLALAMGPTPPQWALKAVAAAVGLDGEYIKRTGHLPKGRTYVWAK